MHKLQRRNVREWSRERIREHDDRIHFIEGIEDYMRLKKQHIVIRERKEK